MARAVVQYYDARGAEVRRVVEAGELPDAVAGDEVVVGALRSAGLIEDEAVPDGEEVSDDAGA